MATSSKSMRCSRWGDRGMGIETPRGEPGSAGPPRLPVLSHARVQKYLACPEQYRLHYVERWRPKQQPASLIFGRVIHLALAALFQTGEDPVTVFTRLWKGIEDADLLYRYRESWEKFLTTGERLLELFVEKELAGLGRVVVSEHRFEVTLPNLPVRFIGIVDALALTEDRKLSVVDFKTAGAAYGDPGHGSPTS